MSVPERRIDSFLFLILDSLEPPECVQRATKLFPRLKWPWKCEQPMGDVFITVSWLIFWKQQIIIVFFFLIDELVDCFQCSNCNHRFCVGDRFHLHENRILCEYDFEELTVYGPTASTYSSHIEKLKKATESLASSSPPPVVNVNDDNGSSGYGSPDSLLSEGKWHEAKCHNRHWTSPILIITSHKSHAIILVDRPLAMVLLSIVNLGSPS